MAGADLVTTLVYVCHKSELSPPCNLVHCGHFFSRDHQLILQPGHKIAEYCQLAQMQNNGPGLLSEVSVYKCKQSDPKREQPMRQQIQICKNMSQL